MKRYDNFNPEHILCPVDFSELSDLALRYAAVGAREFNANLTVLHAEPFELPRYFSRTQTDQFLKELEALKKGVEKDLVERVNRVLKDLMADLRLNYAIVDRQPAEAILDTAEDSGADLIILGTHGYGGVKRFFLGSVAQRIVENATIPTFLVRQKESAFIDVNQPNAVPRLKKILCPCYVSRASEVNLKYAISLARRFHSELTVFYSHENDEVIDFDQLKNRMNEWIRKVGNNDVPIEMVVRKGHAAEQIIQYAGEKGEDLIILAARFQTIGQGTFFGKTTDLVIRHAPVPVLVTPYDAEKQ
jgi:nucleotide-binding universal stress UspA family protein